MHFIQSHILDKLIHAEKLRNRDMRPPNIDSNLYQYHLMRLQKEGYILKENIYYKLTGRGLAYADRHSTTLRKTRSQPKIITVIFLYNKSGEVLLVPRIRQPFMGMYNLPSGKIHLDETVEAAARREISEKAGDKLEVGSINHIGSSHITINQSDYTISDYVALLIEAPVSMVPEGLGKFVDPNQALPDNTMPGVTELLQAFTSKSLFSEHSVSIAPVVLEETEAKIDY
jgi:ADP-ribose pyrophosphatase YjhB (NUDIX family)